MPSALLDFRVSPVTISDSDPRFSRLKVRLREMQTLTVAIGVFPDAGTVAGTDYPMEELAYVHEYGSLDGHTPSRSFMRSTLKRLTPRISEMHANMLETLSKDGRRSVKQHLKSIGVLVSEGMKKTIQDGIAPPLTASTMKHRKNKSGPPLLDSGHLMNSITYKVRPSADNEGTGNMVSHL